VNAELRAQRLELRRLEIASQRVERR